MRSFTRVIDLRLALPVVIAWTLLAGVLLEAELHQREFDFALVIMLICGGGILLWAQLPRALVLAFVFSAVLLGVYVIRRGSHFELKPWEKQDELLQEGSWEELLRQNFTELSKVLPGSGGELLPGLSIGETSRVSDALDMAMKTVSLSHVTAVSGANCVIVTASVMVLAGWFGFPRWVRILSAAVALILFVFLVTPDPSVVRAAVMALIVMFALFVGRPASGVPLLAVAALGMLVWNPWWAIEYGFILSVAATAGLLVFSFPITAALGKWLPWWASALVVVPLSAQLMCQPFIMLLSPYFPSYGILANILVAPAAPISTIFGLVACVTQGFAPVVALMCLWIAWLPSQWIASTALTLSQFPYAQLPWPEGIGGASLAAVLAGLCILFLLTSRRIVRIVAFLMVFILITVCVLLPASLKSFGISGVPTGWQIAFCDVGQGDAIFIQSEGEIALIDTGSSVEKLKQCQRNLGVSSISTFFLTHFDKDHAGAMSAVMGIVHTAYVGPPEDLGDQISLESLVSSGTIVRRADAGQTGTLGGVSWQILWPNAVRPDLDRGNDGSVTVYFQFPEFSAIFLGDLGREAQEALQRSSSLGHIDVVKVAHHGSADQSFPLYEQLSPRVAVLSVGAKNRYGHPRKEIMDVLQQQGAVMPRTDQDGMIAVYATTSGLSIWREH